MNSAERIIDTGKVGVIYGVAAYSLWGFLPLYWKMVQVVPSIEVLAHRMLWAFVFVTLVVFLTGGVPTVVATVTNRKKIVYLFCSSVTISFNWGMFIYAVNSDQVIEASMGYFINPLVVVLLGVTVFREKMSRLEFAAIILAALGVVLITVQYGRLPWIALLLAGSFALYGLLKKMARVDSITGLLVESFIVMPIALIYIVSLSRAEVGSFGAISPKITLVLIGAGAVTAIPLLLFARGIENTTFSMMGFLQYIAPTINLILGVFVFKEYFSLVHFFSFCLIWLALAIFTVTNLGVLKKPLPVPTETCRSTKSV